MVLVQLLKARRAGLLEPLNQTLQASHNLEDVSVQWTLYTFHQSDLYFVPRMIKQKGTKTESL